MKAECRQGLYAHDGNGTVTVRSRGLAADNLTSVTIEVALGSTPAVPGTPGVAPGLPPVLCVSGKNACDDTLELKTPPTHRHQRSFYNRT